MNEIGKTLKLPKDKKENHKYIGFHNQKEVVSVFGSDKRYAERKCKELLLGYFHNLQQNVTRFPLEYYNGVVAYIGVKIEQPETNSKQLEFNFNQEEPLLVELNN